MSGKSSLKFKPMEGFEVSGKTVLLRLDINSPIDPNTGRIVNENRIIKSVPTLRWLLERGARVAVIAHQGDTLDYQNLIPLAEHADKLAAKSGFPVSYIDDVCGPAARAAVQGLDAGEAVVLGNLRYLTEEISTFENAVRLTASGGTRTWLVRSLAPLFDLYINDAFAAAHRNAPSMVSFQQLLPSGAGPLFYREVEALTKIMGSPEPPSVFLLGGAKISDAFGMMARVLEDGTADRILTAGVTGIVFLIASGIDAGSAVNAFLSERGLLPFIEQAEELLGSCSGRIEMPSDLAWGQGGERVEAAVEYISAAAEAGAGMFMDIGAETVRKYSEILSAAGTIFINGPAGVFEDPVFEYGTRELWRSAAASKAYSIVGGGDSVSAADRFTDPDDFSYICTAGGAMVRFVSGRKLPLIEAMEQSTEDGQ